VCNAREAYWCAKEDRWVGAGLKSQRMVARKWITVKVQYLRWTVRIETREVESLEGVSGKLGVW
jgi:hypothetical protein